MLEDYTKLGNQDRVSQILLADASIRKSACWFNVSCALAEQGKELASKYKNYIFYVKIHKIYHLLNFFLNIYI